MDYKKIIERAAQKRAVEKELQEKNKQTAVKNCIEKIKSFESRIKTLLEAKKLLDDNNFECQQLYTDYMYHKVGFALAKNKNVLGIYAGGACGEWNLIVDEHGKALMYGLGTSRVPDYKDIDLLKKFVNKFDDFEIRVENFVDNL